LDAIEAMNLDYVGGETTDHESIRMLLERRQRERKKYLAIDPNDPNVSDADRIIARRERNFGLDPQVFQSQLIEQKTAERNSRIPSVRRDIISGSERLSILAGAFRASVDFYGME